MNLNKVLLIGRLTADPQVRSTPGGAQVTSFSMATNRNWTDKSGAKKEATEFHNVVVWGRQAEIAAKFLSKGSEVYVEGRLQTRSWEGKDGQQRKTTEIVCERMQLGSRRGPSDSGSVAKNQGADNQSVADDMPVIDVGDGDIKPEDLPF
ncbi:MAG: single-stranded DNA-binding protein [Patescibacteria group bacterium]|nr:single-stranded DNA-binding protein [Patescibacteria group bacterium]MCL5224367.1 single-stranded DNA-binding protein [Patescibacteria group bacterium]